MLKKWVIEQRLANGMDRDGKIIKQYHTGGIVEDGQPLKSTEIMAKLLKGELVTTESQADNFIKNVLPKIAGVSSFGGGTGDIKVEMPINVAGNLDETVLPQLENMVEKVVGKINNAMFKRGNNRNAKALSI